MIIRKPTVSWLQPLSRKKTNLKSPSRVNSPFVDCPFRVPSTNRREPGETKGKMQKTPPNSKTPTVPATDTPMEVERADNALPHVTQPDSSTPLAAGRLTHFQQN